MLLVPIWMIITVGILLSFLGGYTLILFHQRAVLRTKLHNKIKINITDGSSEAIEQSKWVLAYQITQADLLHEDIAKIRERGR